MRIENSALCETFRQAGQCEVCGDYYPRRQCCHVFACGMADAYRLDIRENLYSGCVYCHNAEHYGDGPTQAELLDIVAKREYTTPEAIRQLVSDLRRMPSDSVARRPKKQKRSKQPATPAQKEAARQQRAVYRNKLKPALKAYRKAQRAKAKAMKYPRPSRGD